MLKQCEVARKCSLSNTAAISDLDVTCFVISMLQFTLCLPR